MSYVPSTPFNSPFMSLTFSRYVRVIFHVCPVLALCFPVIPPVLPSFSFLSLSCPFQFPFVSLSLSLSLSLISRCFPDMWTSYFLPSFPCTSLHFPFAPQYFPQQTLFFSSIFAKRTSKNTAFFQMFPCTSLHFPLAPQYFPQKTQFFQQRGHPKTQSFPDFLQKQAGNPNQQKAGRGIEPGTPVWLPEDCV